MNSVNIIGRLVRDPESVATQSGTEMTTFSIAVDKGRDEVSYFDCKCFKQTAANVAQYKRKGDQVGVSGHLDQDRWTDKETGKNRSKVVIIADRVTFVGQKQDPGVAHPDPVVAQAEPVFEAKATDMDDYIPF